MNIKPFPDAPWFEIDEDQYLVYLLKGYEINLASKQFVYFSLDGKYHREDGPAVIYEDGSVYYYQNDKLHREDGPAVIWSDGYVEYWKNGLRHRDGGPAIIRNDGTVGYFLNGVGYSEEVYHEALKNGTVYPLS